MRPRDGLGKEVRRATGSTNLEVRGGGRPLVLRVGELLGRPGEDQGEGQSEGRLQRPMDSIAQDMGFPKMPLLTA